MTIVRITVARSALKLDTASFANSAVNAAKLAEPSANQSQGGTTYDMPSL